jgi:hypothetical protein
MDAMQALLSRVSPAEKALGASETDTIVGVLYLGSVAMAGKEKEPDPEGVVAEWDGRLHVQAPPT